MREKELQAGLERLRAELHQLHDDPAAAAQRAERMEQSLDQLRESLANLREAASTFPPAHRHSPPSS